MRRISRKSSSSSDSFTDDSSSEEEVPVTPLKRVTLVKQNEKCKSTNKCPTEELSNPPKPSMRKVEKYRISADNFDATKLSQMRNTQKVNKTNTRYRIPEEYVKEPRRIHRIPEELVPN